MPDEILITNEIMDEINYKKKRVWFFHGDLKKANELIC